MHKEVRYPTDDAPVHNPAAFRVRSSYTASNASSSSYGNFNNNRPSSYNNNNASETSFLERIQDTRSYSNRYASATTALNGAGGGNNNSNNGANNMHQQMLVDGAAAADDGNFVGMGAIGRTWMSAYKVPPIEATEAELLAARAISAGEYKFVARMVMWAMWAIMRSIALRILPGSWKQAFLDSNLFTWSVKKDDAKEGNISANKKGAPTKGSGGGGDGKKGEDRRSVSPSASRRSATREEEGPKPFVF